MLLLELTALAISTHVRLPNPDLHPPVLRFTAVSAPKPAEHDLPEFDLYADPCSNESPGPTADMPAGYVERFRRFGMDLL